jgi:hypothetical protein
MESQNESRQAGGQDGGTDRESETAPGTDRESDTAPGTDRESETAPGADRESETALGADRESETAPGADRKGGPDQDQRQGGYGGSRGGESLPIDGEEEG